MATNLRLRERCGKMSLLCGLLSPLVYNKPGDEKSVRSLDRKTYSKLGSCSMELGGGFGNRPFNTCNLSVRFLTVSQYIYNLKTRSLYVQWIKYLSKYTNVVQPTTIERCKVKYSMYVCNEPRTFPNVQVLLSNVATTIEFFDKRCVIVPQLFKFTNVVLKSDRPPQPNVVTIDTSLILRTKKLLGKLRFFPTKCTNFGFRNQSQTYPDNRLFKMGTHRRFRPCHKVFKHGKHDEIVSKNVTTNCFVAQTKLPSHVEAQSTKRSGLQHSCRLFKKGSILRV